MFLAIVLSLGVVLTFSLVFDMGAPPEDTGSEPTAQQTETVEDQSPEQSEPSEDRAAQDNDTTSGDQSQSAQDTDEASPEPREVAEVSGDTVAFETEKLRGYFTLEGARLQSLKVKGYSKLHQPDKAYDLVAQEGRGLYVETGYPEPVVRDLTFQRLETEDPHRYTFETTLPSGLKLRKEYRFDPEEDYRLHVDVQVHNPTDESQSMENLGFEDENSGSLALFWGPGFGRERAERGFLDNPYVYYWKNGGMDSLAPEGGGYGQIIGFGGGEEDQEGPNIVEGPLDWTGPSSRYFTVSSVPDQSYDYLALEQELYSKAEQNFTTWSGYEGFDLRANETRRFQFDLHMGPKNYYELQEFQDGMEESMNFWFSWLYLPQAMLWVLHTVYSVIPNYGIAIIILSFLIKFMLYPLTKKGLVSMRKMRELQPEMKRIQEEYEDDKEKQQEKMIEFYQEHDLNPLGGCLPLLLQVPFFIALYSILRYGIELRGAPFFLWITDLSAMDPYYIMPVLMGVLMFFQQKYTMSSGGGGSMGQQQQMMMYIMPPMMTFFFLSFPVGLVLYFMTNSGVTVLQYWLIDKSMEAEET